jgi:hypothetical protein
LKLHGVACVEMHKRPLDLSGSSVKSFPMKTQKTFQWTKTAPVIAGLLSLFGVILYAVLSWGHAHGQVSVIDEGLYLYKGFLFASGEYRPFQDFGPLTNHMPLSFLIPGYVQKLFGAGIRTGRMMSIALGLMMLIGLWLATKRFVGHWWATAAIWTVALNSALIKVYSQAVSQVLVACMLVWVIVLVSGQRRPLWQIVLGVIMAGALLFTRINIAPVLPIVIMYIFWQHGKRAGLVALLVGLVIVVIGHAVYWPDILKLWAKWVPEAISPFLSNYRLPSEVVPFWDPQISIDGRVDSLLMSLRMHFIPFVGFLGMLILLSAGGKQIDESWRTKSGWLFVSLFGILFLAHAAASLGLNYCVYCLRNYMAFFSPIGLILLGMFGRKIGKVNSLGKVLLLLLALMLIPFSLGFTLGDKLTENLLSIDVTKIKAMLPQSGTYQLHLLLENKFALPIDSLQIAGQGLIYALLIIVPLLAIFIERFTEKRPVRGGISFLGSFRTGLIALLILELTLANAYFSTGYLDFDCGKNVIQAHEVVGEYLATKIPEESRIYWGVGRSPVPLLYLPNRHVFPSQLNGDYTYMLSGESSVLEKFGYWDSQLGEAWLLEADYVLVEERVYSELFSLGFDHEIYDEITRTALTDPCRADSAIMIFRNLHRLE